MYTHEQLLSLACSMRSDAEATVTQGEEYLEGDASQEVEQSPGEPPKDYKDMSEKAWAMSSAFQHGKLHDAHKDAAMAHKEAAKAAEEAGDGPRAEAHKSMAVEHGEHAVKVKEAFKDSSMY